MKTERVLIGVRKPIWVAQAKFMRGVCYYVLYSFYGGVPLRLTPSDRESLAVSRATRQQTIDQIIKDWTEAAVDLDETSSLASNKPTAPNKYSAYAYLAKLYWVMGCNAWAAENGDYWGYRRFEADVAGNANQRCLF